MKRKESGRKVYRTKEKNYYGKTPFQKFMSGLLTVLLIGGIGFIGYSTAGPLINFNQHTGDKPDETVPEEETEPDTEENTVDSEESTIDSTDTGDTTEPTTAEPVTMEQYSAFALTVSDLASEEALQAAIDAVPKNQGIEYIEVPLKVSGGMIYYLSTVVTDNALKENQKLNLVKISETIRENGYKPAAVVSTFRDNILPSVDKTTGYTRTDGSLWYDTALKPWVSPYSQTALDYLVSVTEEISGNGFDRIICTDFVFPKFTDNDLNNLDEVLGKTERCMALTSAANLLYDTSVSGGSSMFIEVSAADILAGSSDILQPILLSVNTIVLNINIDELGSGVSDGRNYYEFSGKASEKLSKCIGFLSSRLSDFNVIVRISGSTLTTQNLIEVKETIAECGYNSFVLG